MKKIISVLIFAFMLIAPSSVFAGANVNFAWDYPNPDADFSHFVIQENTSGQWIGVSGNIAPALREFTLTDLPDGSYTWRLLTVDTTALSTPSNEVTADLEDTSGPPAPAQNFRILTTIYVEIRGGKIVAQNIESDIMRID